MLKWAREAVCTLVMAFNAFEKVSHCNSPLGLEFTELIRCVISWEHCVLTTHGYSWGGSGPWVQWHCIMRSIGGDFHPPNHHQWRLMQGTCFFFSGLLPWGPGSGFSMSFPEFTNCRLAALASPCNTDWLTGCYLWLSCALQHWAFLIMGLSSE